ncbi:hypothetical protein [Endozoicomonas sp.]|uniref:hypothetical protein n=1 Tax=Endozoicomonas sp. TaxID=1892382 RepID=UPI00383AAA61
MIDLTKNPDQLARIGLISLEKYNVLRMKSDWLPNALLELNSKIHILKTANIASPEDLDELEQNIQSYLLASHTIHNKARHTLLPAKISNEDRLLSLKDGGEVEEIFVSPNSDNKFDPVTALFDEDHRTILVLIGIGAYGLADLSERNNAYRLINFCFNNFSELLIRKSIVKRKGESSPESYQEAKETIQEISQIIWSHQTRRKSDITTKGKMVDILIDVIQQLQMLDEWPDNSLTKQEKTEKLSSFKKLRFPDKKYIQRTWLSHAPDKASRRGRPSREKQNGEDETIRGEVSKEILNMR